MKVLVTGTDGYIGSQLVGVLAARGHQVTGVDAGFYRDGRLYGSGVPSTTQVRKDIRDLNRDDLEGYDAVVHLAELSNDPLGQQNPEVTYQINHQGSVALARLCKDVGVKRFVYTSSCSVYGVGSDEFKTEESTPNPQTAYAECKVLVERDVRALGGDGFSPTFLRNATAFGASPRMRFDIVLNNLAGLAWTRKTIAMTSDGTPWRPLVHVLDICEAIACTLAAPRDVVHNQVFNVGDSRFNYRVREIAEIVAAAFPGCAVTFGPADKDNRSYRVSFDKIHERLPGFVCRRDAATGARELHNLFSEIQMSTDKFEFRAFTRLKQIKYLLETGQIDEHLRWRETNGKTVPDKTGAEQDVTVTPATAYAR
jgi:nucleoside-diphosphate-sugar epimerase